MKRNNKKSKVIFLLVFLAFFIVIFIAKFLLSNKDSIYYDVKNTISNTTSIEDIILKEIKDINSVDLPYNIDSIKLNEEGLFDSGFIDLKRRYAYDNLEFFYQYDRFYDHILKNESYYKDNSKYIESLLDKTLFLCTTNFKKYISDDYKLNIIYIDYKKNLENDILYDGVMNLYDIASCLYNYDLSIYNNIVFINDYNKNFIDGDLSYKTFSQICNYINKKNQKIKTFFTELIILDNNIEISEKINIFNSSLNNYLKSQYIFINKFINNKSSNFDVNMDNILSYLSFYTNFIDLKNRDYVNKKHITKDDIKTSTNKEIFLTFDDGPSENTLNLLNILNKYNVKASFFVTNQHSGFINNLKDIVDAGHTIAAHTYSHNYSIYRSKESYLEDLYKIECVIRKETGIFTNLIRFPGGSINSNNSKLPMKEFVEEIQDMGYIYYDWNVSSGDGADISSEQTLNNIITGISKNKQKYIVLMHDTKLNTINIVDELLQYLNSNKFNILGLKEDSYVCHMVFK